MGGILSSQILHFFLVQTFDVLQTLQHQPFLPLVTGALSKSVIYLSLLDTKPLCSCVMNHHATYKKDTSARERCKNPTHRERNHWDRGEHNENCLKQTSSQHTNCTAVVSRSSNKWLEQSVPKDEPLKSAQSYTIRFCFLVFWWLSVSRVSLQ